MKKLNIAQGVITFLMLSLWLGVAVGTVSLVTMKEGRYYEMSEPHLRVKSDELQKSLGETLANSIPESFRIRVDTMKLSQPIDGGLKVLLLSIVYLSVGYLTYVLFVFKSIINDVRRSNSFNRDNIQRVKLLGLLIVIAPFANWLVAKAMVWWLEYNYLFDGLKVVSDSSFDFTVFLMGLIIMVLGVAFEQGQEIQQENELTI
jgi:hypothetical protein